MAKEPIMSCRKQKKKSNMKLLNGDNDWKVSVDLKTSLQFPFHIIQTEKRPDIVEWSDSKKRDLIELTASWEENREEAHEPKKNGYKTLSANWVEKGLICHEIPSEVGCCGFLGHTVISFLSKIGITGRILKVASYHLQTMMQNGSSWIWLSAKSLQHMESPFQCDYVISRKGHCKRLMTWTAESKRVLISHTALKWKWTYNVISPFSWSGIYI